MDNKGQRCRGLQHEKATKEKDTESLQSGNAAGIAKKRYVSVAGRIAVGSLRRKSVFKSRKANQQPIAETQIQPVRPAGREFHFTLETFAADQ